ncbi:nucleosidase [Streptomyces sp. NPDC058464]|uniref:5'-methylthioadenosine/S-adenosylhomocysteine nucleosidase family protein n=1 Tax=Streptomyces sp. NPDC058464 TaxID=3346511 RepID=UPI00365949C9
MPGRNPLAAVITTVPAEYESMRSHLPNLRDRIAGDHGLRIEVGALPGSGWQVALAESGEFGAPFAPLVNDIVHALHPDALLFVGIAGGLEEGLRIGDVVVATRVYAFRGGKLTPEGFYARPQSWHPSHRMLQAARYALHDTPRVFFKAIAAGDVVINSQQSSLLSQLKRHYNDAAAIEMEGAGMAHAGHLTAGVETLTIRGISDVANTAKDFEIHGGAQQYAAARAAEVAVAVLRKFDPLPDQSVDEAHYGGDHIDFRGSTFFGPVAGKVTAERPHGDDVNFGRRDLNEH